MIHNTNEQSKNRKDNCPLMQRQRHLRHFSASGDAASTTAANQQVGHSVTATPEFCDCSFLFSSLLLFIFIFEGRYLYSSAHTPSDDSTVRKCIPRGPLGDVRGPGGGLVRPQAECQLLQSFTYRLTMSVCDSVCVSVCFNNLGLFADAQSDSFFFFLS